MRIYRCPPTPHVPKSGSSSEQQGEAVAMISAVFADRSLKQPERLCCSKALGRDVPIIIWVTAHNAMQWASRGHGKVLSTIFYIAEGAADALPKVLLFQGNHLYTGQECLQHVLCLDQPLAFLIGIAPLVVV